MRARAVKAHGAVGRYRILRLVAVAQDILSAEDLLNGDAAAADTRERILHALLLQPQLLTVAHVAVSTAAAARKIRTVRRDTLT